MTTFRLNVDTENAAFDPDPRPELARILRDAADRVEASERADDIGWFALKNADGSPWVPSC